MGALHTALAAFFGLTLDPFARLGPLLGLTVISAISGVLLLLAFRLVSNPAAIRTARHRVQAHLLAVRLYRDDLTVVFRSQRALLGGLLVYLGHMMLPFLVLLVPFGLLFAHLDARYGARALRPGETALVKATVVPDTIDRWQLAAGDGVAVETRPIRIPARGEIVWRLRATASGRHEIALVNGSHRSGLAVRVADAQVGAAPRRAAAGFETLLLAPTEPVIPADTGVESIEVRYPSMHFEVLGWNVHWIVVFLVVSAAVAFAFRKQVGAEF